MRKFLALCLAIVLILVVSCTQVPAPNAAAPNASSTDIAATVQAAVAATVQAAVNATIAAMPPVPTVPQGTVTQPPSSVIGTPIVQPTSGVGPTSSVEPTSIVQPTSTEVGIGPIISGTEVVVT